MSWKGSFAWTFSSDSWKLWGFSLLNNRAADFRERSPICRYRLPCRPRLSPFCDWLYGSSDQMRILTEGVLWLTARSSGLSETCFKILQGWTPSKLFVQAPRTVEWGQKAWRKLSQTAPGLRFSLSTSDICECSHDKHWRTSDQLRLECSAHGKLT